MVSHASSGGTMHTAVDMVDCDDNDDDDDDDVEDDVCFDLLLADL